MHNVRVNKPFYRAGACLYRIAANKAITIILMMMMIIIIIIIIIIMMMMMMMMTYLG